jgi:hypothetical protein
MDIEKTNNSMHRHGFRQGAGRFYLPKERWLFVAALCLMFSFAAGAASFTASLDRDNITLGESATLSLEFQGGQPQNVPTPDVPGLQIVSTGNAQNFSFINGQMSSVVAVTFSVTPQQSGDFTIPAMTFDIGGQRFVSQPLKLTVTQPSAPNAAQINAGTQLAFMRFSLPNQTLYIGQVVVGQLQIFIRDDVQHYQDLGVTGQNADGFAINKMVAAGQGQRMQFGDHNYMMIPVSVALTVTKSGTVTVGPITANVTVITGAQQTFFGELMGGQQQQIPMATDPVRAQAFMLPAQNVPANFNGAVGDYTLTYSAGPTKLAVGDPITVHVTISGGGALDSIALPNQAGWDDFKMVSPTSKTDYSDGVQDEGTRTFEEFAMPQSANVRELPPFSFSFFNPDDGNYHTLTGAATPLEVTAVGATPMPTVAGVKESPGENQAPQDILPIRENLGALAQAGTPLVARPAFLALQSLPVLAFLAALVWRKRTDNLANNPRLRRQRAVAQLIAGGLEDLNQFAAENKATEFFAMLFRLLQEQLGERLDCPAISITEADADDRLVALGAKPETMNALRELFHACNQARYAPIQTSQELSALAGKFKKAAGELQELKT